jgi:selenocysteine lyase/cysteine desulfurase
MSNSVAKQSTSLTANLASFREMFPILQNSVYLNSCAKGALCAPVRGAVENFLNDWDQLGAPWQLWSEKAQDLRTRFAAFIGAKPNEIAITLSASSAADSIASAMEYTTRRKIVLGDQEYPTMAQIWLAQERRGANVQFVHSRAACPTPDDYAEAVDEQTLIVPLTHVSFRNGSTLAVKEITKNCHSRGAYVLLDDYQCTGTRPLNVKDLDVDFLVTGMLKYMLGPPGIAFIYVREELIPTLRPYVTGWFGRQDPFSLDITKVDYADSARRFETGTFPVGPIYGSLAALSVMSSLGCETIAEQISLLTKRALPALTNLGLNVTTPSDSQGPMVAIETDDLYPLLEHLKQRKILIAGRNNLFRVSFHAYNSIDDVDALLDAMQEWARLHS